MTSVAVVFSVTSVVVVKVVGNDLFGGLVFSVTSVAMVEVVGNDFCPNSKTPPRRTRGEMRLEITCNSMSSSGFQ